MPDSSSRTGIYSHGSDEVYVPEYDENSLFSVSEAELKTKLLDALINSYRTGDLVNLRRHIATSNVGDKTQKCVVSWNSEQISLAESEVLLKTDKVVYYFKSTLIYNVFRYDYKPDISFISTLISKFG